MLDAVHDQLEEILKCAVCRGILNDPVVMPCGHALDQECLQNLCMQADNKQCPHCRAPANSRKQDVNKALKGICNLVEANVARTDPRALMPFLQCDYCDLQLDSSQNKDSKRASPLALNCGHTFCNDCYTFASRGQASPACPAVDCGKALSGVADRKRCVPLTEVQQLLFQADVDKITDMQRTMLRQMKHKKPIVPRVPRPKKEKTEQTYDEKLASRKAKQEAKVAALAADGKDVFTGCREVLGMVDVFDKITGKQLVRRSSCHICTQGAASWRGSIDVENGMLGCTECPLIFCHRCLNHMCPDVDEYEYIELMKEDYKCPMCSETCACQRVEFDSIKIKEASAASPTILTLEKPHFFENQQAISIKNFLVGNKDANITKIVNGQSTSVKVRLIAGKPNQVALWRTEKKTAQQREAQKKKGKKAQGGGDTSDDVLNWIPIDLSGAFKGGGGGFIGLTQIEKHKKAGWAGVTGYGVKIGSAGHGMKSQSGAAPPPLARRPKVWSEHVAERGIQDSAAARGSGPKRSLGEANKAKGAQNTSRQPSKLPAAGSKRKGKCGSSVANPIRAYDRPDTLVGMRVEVFWVEEKEWFPAKVEGHEPTHADGSAETPFRIKYDDGDEEWMGFPDAEVRMIETVLDTFPVDVADAAPQVEMEEDNDEAAEAMANFFDVDDDEAEEAEVNADEMDEAEPLSDVERDNSSKQILKRKGSPSSSPVVEEEENEGVGVAEQDRSITALHDSDHEEEEASLTPEEFEDLAGPLDMQADDLYEYNTADQEVVLSQGALVDVCPKSVQGQNHISSHLWATQHALRMPGRVDKVEEDGHSFTIVLCVDSTGVYDQHAVAKKNVMGRPADNVLEFVADQLLFTVSGAERHSIMWSQRIKHLPLESGCKVSAKQPSVKAQSKKQVQRDSNPMKKSKTGQQVKPAQQTHVPKASRAKRVSQQATPEAAPPPPTARAAAPPPLQEDRGGGAAAYVLRRLFRGYGFWSGEVIGFDKTSGKYEVEYHSEADQNSKPETYQETRTQLLKRLNVSDGTEFAALAIQTVTRAGVADC